MKKARTNQIISVLLCIALLVTSVPAAAFAEATESETGQAVKTEEEGLSAWEEDLYGTAEFDGEEAEELPEVLAEDPSLREETVKHFLNADGSYTAVNYFMPVHYQKEGTDRHYHRQHRIQLYLRCLWKSPDHPCRKPCVKYQYL